MKKLLTSEQRQTIRDACSDITQGREPDGCDWIYIKNDDHGEYVTEGQGQPDEPHICVEINWDKDFNTSYKVI